ncbi:Salivary plasminogen activator alpha 1 [Lucilia cuprina]|nr:Salivary plasminogen activator alpha 1 [Lucilia cuprina]
MYSNEDMKKIAKIFIVIFLCSEMQPSVTQNNSYEQRVLYYSSHVNTTQASFSNAQHHASIRLKDHDQNFGNGHICSGVVIGPSVVLTTAQCVYNYNKNKPYHPSELKVVLASLSRYQLQEQTLIYSVTHSYQPKTFDTLRLRDNVAILMLERDIPEMNEYVQAITLPQAKVYNTNWYDKQNGGQFKVTTWLKTHEDLHLNHLMLLNASQVSDETCLQYYGKTLFTTGMLCINTNESLQEDFGSPLFVDNKLVGLRSLASGHLSPAIYTDVSHHAKWISEIIGDGTNQNSSIWGSMGFLLLTYVALKRSKFMKL